MSYLEPTTRTNYSGHLGKNGFPMRKIQFDLVVSLLIEFGTYKGRNILIAALTHIGKLRYGWAQNEPFPEELALQKHWLERLSPEDAQIMLDCADAATRFYFHGVRKVGKSYRKELTQSK
jgi:hypothetical protein